MPEHLQTTRHAGGGTRAVLYGLLIAFNALIWILLWAFHWEVSLRAREADYFGRQLFPVRRQVVPIPVIYAACGLLTLASLALIARDRSNLAARERLRTLLSQILESLEIGVFVFDGKGILSLANESAHKLLPRIPPGPAEVAYADALQGYPDIAALVTKALETGSYVRELEYELGSPDEPCPVRVTTLPLRDRQKHASGILLLVSDVREVVAMERQMRAAERLSTLGTLAAALAHEIRNPLEALNLNLELLERSLESPRMRSADAGKRQKYLRVLEDEIARLGGIVENFLSFARPGPAPVGTVRLDRILQQVVELVDNQARSRKVEIEIDTDGQAMMVEGSEDQLKQVFLNLVINGLEAMPAGGRLSIRAETVENAESGGPRRSAVVRIRDTGEGIAAEAMPRLFDPFFSTRPRGTGLGLTIARRVIQEHHGQIGVESSPGAGATFTVELPLAQSRSA